MDFWRIINESTSNLEHKDVPLLATYSYSGRWADHTMGEQFVKKLFPNAIKHSDDLNSLQTAYSLLDYEKK